jgi:hypothetical protein
MVGAPSKLSGNGTEAGFHVMLRSMSDRFVAVDEVTEGAASNVLPQLIYAIGNGSARVRARKSGEVELQQPINCTLLLSGEKGIFDYLATQGGRFMPGHFARFIGVAPDQPFGCFSDLGPYSTGAEFSREIVNHCNSHYGTFWPTFIKKIFDDQGRTESYLQRNMLKVRATIARSVTSDQNQDLVERLVDNAARVAMAGELATAFKLLPWRSGTATEAMAKTASAWVGRYLAAAMAPADYVQKLRKHIAPLRKQFPNWEEEGLNAKKACWTGFIYEHRAGEKYILISPALMEAVFGKEGVSKAVEALRESGLILPGERGAALKEIRIPGTAEKIRFYFIKKDVMKPNS